MYKIQIIYDNLAKANIIGLKAALGSIKSVKNIIVDENISTVILLSDKKKIREDLLKNAGDLNNCNYRVIVSRKRV